MTWMSKLRLRVLVFVIGLPLAAMAAISVSPSWLALPFMGVAFYATVLAVSKVTGRLARPTCWTCGADISGEPGGDHGVACPNCGALNHRVAVADGDGAAGRSGPRGDTPRSEAEA